MRPSLWVSDVEVPVFEDSLDASALGLSRKGIEAVHIEELKRSSHVLAIFASVEGKIQVYDVSSQVHSGSELIGPSLVGDCRIPLPDNGNICQQVRLAFGRFALEEERHEDAARANPNRGWIESFGGVLTFDGKVVFLLRFYVTIAGSSGFLETPESSGERPRLEKLELTVQRLGLPGTLLDTACEGGWEFSCYVGLSSLVFQTAQDREAYYVCSWENRSAERPQRQALFDSDSNKALEVEVAGDSVVLQGTVRRITLEGSVGPNLVEKGSYRTALSYLKNVLLRRGNAGNESLAEDNFGWQAVASDAWVSSQQTSSVIENNAAEESLLCTASLLFSYLIRLKPGVSRGAKDKGEEENRSCLEDGDFSNETAVTVSDFEEVLAVYRYTDTEDGLRLVCWHAFSPCSMSALRGNTIGCAETWTKAALIRVSCTGQTLCCYRPYGTVPEGEFVFLGVMDRRRWMDSDKALAWEEPWFQELGRISLPACWTRGRAPLDVKLTETEALVLYPDSSGRSPCLFRIPIPGIEYVPKAFLGKLLGTGQQQGVVVPSNSLKAQALHKGFPTQVASISQTLLFTFKQDIAAFPEILLGMLRLVLVDLIEDPSEEEQARISEAFLMFVVEEMINHLTYWQHSRLWSEGMVFYAAKKLVERYYQKSLTDITKHGKESWNLQSLLKTLIHFCIDEVAAQLGVMGPQAIAMGCSVALRILLGECQENLRFREEESRGFFSLALLLPASEGESRRPVLVEVSPQGRRLSLLLPMNDLQSVYFWTTTIELGRECSDSRHSFTDALEALLALDNSEHTLWRLYLAVHLTTRYAVFPEGTASQQSVVVERRAVFDALYRLHEWMWGALSRPETCQLDCADALDCLFGLNPEEFISPTQCDDCATWIWEGLKMKGKLPLLRDLSCVRLPVEWSETEAMSLLDSGAQMLLRQAIYEEGGGKKVFRDMMQRLCVLLDVGKCDMEEVAGEERSASCLGRFTEYCETFALLCFLRWVLQRFNATAQRFEIVQQNCLSEKDRDNVAVWWDTSLGGGSGGNATEGVLSLGSEGCLVSEDLQWVVKTEPMLRRRFAFVRLVTECMSRLDYGENFFSSSVSYNISCKIRLAVHIILSCHVGFHFKQKTGPLHGKHYVANAPHMFPVLELLKRSAWEELYTVIKTFLRIDRRPFAHYVHAVASIFFEKGSCVSLEADFEAASNLGDGWWLPFWRLQDRVLPPEARSRLVSVAHYDECVSAKETQRAGLVEAKKRYLLYVSYWMHCAELCRVASDRERNIWCLKRALSVERSSLLAKDTTVESLHQRLWLFLVKDLCGACHFVEAARLLAATDVDNPLIVKASFSREVLLGVGYREAVLREQKHGLCLLGVVCANDGHSQAARHRLIGFLEAEMLGLERGDCSLNEVLSASKVLSQHFELFGTYLSLLGQLGIILDPCSIRGRLTAQVFQHILAFQLCDMESAALHCYLVSALLEARFCETADQWKPTDLLMSLAYPDSLIRCLARLSSGLWLEGRRAAESRFPEPRNPGLLEALHPGLLRLIPEHRGSIADIIEMLSIQKDLLRTCLGYLSKLTFPASESFLVPVCYYGLPLVEEAKQPSRSLFKETGLQHTIWSSALRDQEMLVLIKIDFLSSVRRHGGSPDMFIHRVMQNSAEGLTGLLAKAGLLEEASWCANVWGLSAEGYFADFVRAFVEARVAKHAQKASKPRTSTGIAVMATKNPLYSPNASLTRQPRISQSQPGFQSAPLGNAESEDATYVSSGKRYRSIFGSLPSQEAGTRRASFFYQRKERYTSEQRVKKGGISLTRGALANQQVSSDGVPFLLFRPNREIWQLFMQTVDDAFQMNNAARPFFNPCSVFIQVLTLTGVEASFQDAVLIPWIIAHPCHLKEPLLFAKALLPEVVSGKVSISVVNQFLTECTSRCATANMGHVPVVDWVTVDRLLESHGFDEARKQLQCFFRSLYTGDTKTQKIII